MNNKQKYLSEEYPICLICNKKFHKRTGWFNSHLKTTHNLTIEQYYDKFLKSEKDPSGYCLHCGNKTEFYPVKMEYRLFCCLDCSQKSDYHREKIKKIQIENFKNNKESILKKRVETIKNKYNSTKEFFNIMKEKRNETKLKLYNDKNYSNKEKIKETWNNKTIKEIKDINKKKKITNKKKYGVEWLFKDDKFKEISKKTKLEKYGDAQYNNRKKMVMTILKRYGIENWPGLKKIKLISKKRKIKWLKKIILRRKKIFYDKIINLYGNTFLPNFTFEKYKGTGYNKIYEWKCVKCGDIFKASIGFSRLPRCKKCYPPSISIYEKIIKNFIKEIYNGNIIENDKKTISPRELDILIPEKNIAIEINGVYWHSELRGKERSYHLSKLKKCNEKNITLLQFTDNECIYKENIVRSMITAKLGLLKNKIYARKCSIKEVTNKESIDFLNKNHIQGKDNSIIKIALYYNEEMVSLITFCNPRYNKKYKWELSRYCNKLDNNVIGGFSKLFSYFIKKYQPENIITYSDRRFSEGNVYSKNGFDFLYDSEPNYFYFKNKKNNSFLLESRLKYQKHKLKNKLINFDESLSEWENMRNNDYDRIWDCGNKVFLWENKKTVVTH
jgi:hypothetical protein